MGQLERPRNPAASFLDVGELPGTAHDGGAQPPAGLLDPLLQLHPILIEEHARQEVAGVELERVTQPTRAERLLHLRRVTPEPVRSEPEAIAPMVHQHAVAQFVPKMK